MYYFAAITIAAARLREAQNDVAHLMEQAFGARHACRP
jgi:hypothetical protein